MASSSALLALAAALAWRYRATVWPLAAAIGLGVATKLIVWPLLVWTLVDAALPGDRAARRHRRRRHARALGGARLRRPRALPGDAAAARRRSRRRRATRSSERSRPSGSARRRHARSRSPSRAGLLVAVRRVRAAAGRRSRRSRRARGRRSRSRRSSGCTTSCSCSCRSAIARPRFSAVWLLPLLLWLTPLNGNGEAIQPLLPSLVAAAVAGRRALRSRAAAGSAGPRTV